MQKSEKPLFMGKTRKDEQRQTNLNSNPDDENAWRKRPVKSRVCGLKDSMVRQEYDKINSLNGLK